MLDKLDQKKDFWTFFAGVNDDALDRNIRWNAATLI